MTQRILGRLLLVVLLAFTMPSTMAEEIPAEVTASENQARLEEMKRQAAEYRLTTAGDNPVKLTLPNEPLLRFSNPVGGVPDGIAVMWKVGARPAVFAQVFQTKEGLWIHECQSLAPERLQMQRGTKGVWQPAAVNENFRALADAPPAATTAIRRLAQMKSIAEQFSAVDDFKIHSSDRETTRHSLRMLPRPIYRYADSAAGITDGAVFAFVHGTDPELFLVLEHRANEKADWFYALAPMTCWAVEAKRDENIVFSVTDRQGKSTDKDPYHVWVYRK